MKTNRPLSHELDETCRLLDGFTREKFHAWQEHQDSRAMRKGFDGSYDVGRIYRGLHENDLARIAPQEKAISDQIAERAGRPPRPGYVFVPYDPPGDTRAILNAASGRDGGFTIATGVGNLFIGYLHANSILMQQGISRLALQGNTGFPKVSGTISTYWNLNETSGPTESQFTFAIEGSSPRTLGSYCELSNQFLKQIDPLKLDFVLREQSRATAADLDGKLISGAGSKGEPTGLTLATGVGSISGTSATSATVLDAVKTVENASGIVRLVNAGFVMAPDVARLFRIREMASGSGTIMNGYSMVGFPCQVSKSVPDGTCIFGDWSQQVLCEWGLLELGVDPYGSDGGLFKKGLVGLRSIWTVDPVILHVESFCKITGIS
jgi:HK97 family phage major capsid protein